ncbi:uncharacterized protein LOC131167520 [Malania oleifera]|uniref:uncharacterized protein LOC131167520 n=1 Tax=Malania oleifera TaxID=397392 RepID=UPI0025AEA097|nr:uncharacterized protein LOC131167520 [Malania oleifera]
MASVLQKLLRKSSSARIATVLSNCQAPNFSAPLAFYQPHVAETTSNHDCTSNLTPLSRSRKTDELSPSQSLRVYPSFSIGYFLNPISSSGLLQSKPDDVVSDGLPTIWADSVKKKRKKKMNKHKYKKLRKRLRQKS